MSSAARIHETVFRRGSRVGMLALHADIEGGTGELAELVAAVTGASLLVFQQPGPDLVRMHSTSFSQDVYPELKEFSESIEFVVSLHGHGRVGDLSETIFVGGGRRRAASLFARAMRTELPGYSIVDDLGSIPSKLRGLRPDNPVNAPAWGGVQIELSASARGCAPFDEPNIPAEPQKAVVLGLINGIQSVVRNFGPEMGLS